MSIAHRLRRPDPTPALHAAGSLIIAILAILILFFGAFLGRVR